MKYLTLVLLLTLLACTPQEPVYFDKARVAKLAWWDDGGLPPPPENNFMMFVQSDGGKICSTNVIRLHYFYERDHEQAYPDFEAFLFEALNQNLEVNEMEEQCVLPDRQVTEEYEKLGIEKFIAKYWNRVEGKLSYRMKRTIDHNCTDEERYTIFYYCFLNNYCIREDCLNGGYTMYKANS